MPRIRSDSRAEAAAEEASRKPVKILSSRDESVTPSLLRELYKTETYVPVAPAGQNVLAIVGMLGQHPNENDLTMLMNEFYPTGPTRPTGLNMSTAGCTTQTAPAWKHPPMFSTLPP